MSLRQLTFEWGRSRRRVALLLAGLLAIVAYECLRTWYRPYIYAAGIDDLHIADTLGNSLGTVATVTLFASLLGRTASQGLFVLRASAMAVAAYEVMHPLLGKPIDAWDLLATVLAAAACDVAYRITFRQSLVGSEGHGA